MKVFRKAADTTIIRQFIDPITFVGQDEKVYRLTGIDVPGLNDPAPPPWIATATARLNKTYRQKTVLLYVSKSQQNRTNRMEQTLVHAVNKSDKTWIQGELVQNGEARVFPTDTSPELATQLYTLERPAIVAKKGLWALPENSVLTPDTASQAIGRVSVIAGRITGVSQQKSMMYLNFGTDWKSDTTFGLSAQLRQALAKKNIDPKTWIGKDVMVRGFVEQYYGPYINLITPAQLMLIEEPLPRTQSTPQAQPPQNTGGLQQLLITPNEKDADNAAQP